MGLPRVPRVPAQLCGQATQRVLHPQEGHVLVVVEPHPHRCDRLSQEVNRGQGLFLPFVQVGGGGGGMRLPILPNTAGASRGGAAERRGPTHPHGHAEGLYEGLGPPLGAVARAVKSQAHAGHTEGPDVLGARGLPVARRPGLRLLSDAKQGGGKGLEGTLVPGEGVGGGGLEESAGGEAAEGGAKVAPGAVGAVAGVAEPELGYEDAEGLGPLGVVQDGGVQGDYQLPGDNMNY